MKSSDKFKTYLHYHGVCGHQTCQGGGIQRVAHPHRPRGKYFQVHIFRYIFPFLLEVPWTPISTRYWLTVRESHPESHKIFWSRDQRWVMAQSEKFISSLLQGLWPLNLAGCWLWEGRSAGHRKVDCKFLPSLMKSTSAFTAAITKCCC